MSRNNSRVTHVDRIPTYAQKSDCVNAVIETPKGSRTKLAYDPKFSSLVVRRVLPEGLSFPFDFGFLPSTLEADGDPMDVLVLLDANVPPLCVVTSRLVGVIEARESDSDGGMVENVRLVAVGEHSLMHADIARLSDVPENVISQIQNFFVSYNKQDGKKFEVTARRGPKVAKRLVKDGQRRWARKHK